MTTEEKLRVIHNWTTDFQVRSMNAELMYGFIILDNTYIETLRHKTQEDVIDTSYHSVRQRVWLKMICYEIRTSVA